MKKKEIEQYVKNKKARGNWGIEREGKIAKWEREREKFWIKPWNLDYHESNFYTKNAFENSHFWVEISKGQNMTISMLE